MDKLDMNCQTFKLAVCDLFYSIDVLQPGLELIYLKKKKGGGSTLVFYPLVASVALMVFIIIGTDSFHFSSTLSEMNSANLFCRKSAGNEKCQHYFRESSDGRMELFDTCTWKPRERFGDMKNGRSVFMQNSQHLVLCWLYMYSLNLENKVGSWSHFFFSLPEACWFFSLWMSRYVLNWASMKKRENLL